MVLGAVEITKPHVPWLCVSGCMQETDGPGQLSIYWLSKTQHRHSIDVWRRGPDMWPTCAAQLSKALLHSDRQAKQVGALVPYVV